MMKFMVIMILSVIFALTIEYHGSKRVGKLRKELDDEFQDVLNEMRKDF